MTFLALKGFILKVQSETFIVSAKQKSILSILVILIIGLLRPDLYDKQVLIWLYLVKMMLILRRKRCFNDC